MRPLHASGKKPGCEGIQKATHPRTQHTQPREHESSGDSSEGKTDRSGEEDRGDAAGCPKGIQDALETLFTSREQVSAVLLVDVL